MRSDKNNEIQQIVRRRLRKRRRDNENGNTYRFLWHRVALPQWQFVHKWSIVVPANGRKERGKLIFIRLLLQRTDKSDRDGNGKTNQNDNGPAELSNLFADSKLHFVAESR